eukprot:TRINITY_DN3900_c0_g2_i2.p1 TRINITY_DN3900_c0_g2~~TRINITY_DN3900_c0_g2_i2.p1  ORF type:complete len:497 (-),score=97.90 TRINITY_DN3900_c0_g2_i2:119-1609(-)
MPSFVTLLSLAVVLVVGVYVWLVKDRSKYAHIPGPPPPSLLLGNYKQLTKDFHKVHQDWTKQYGPVLKFFYGRRPVVLVSSPAAVYEVTQGQFDNFVNRRFPKSHENPSVFTAHDDQWRYLRRSISPTFNALHMKKMMEMMNASVDLLMLKLDKIAKTGEVVNIHEIFARMTLAVIGETAFDMKVSQDEIDDDSESSVLNVAVRAIFENLPNPYNVAELAMSMFPGLVRIVRPIIFKRPPPVLRAMLKASENLRSHTKKIIEERRAEKTTGKGDFVELLLDAQDKETGRKLTDQEVINTCSVFLIAGYETTSTTLGYIAYLLGSHPHVEEKMVKEMMDTFDDHVPTTLDEMKKLTYMDHVINEALRIYPPVAIYSRVAKKDTQLEGFHIPAGTEVAIPNWAMSRDPSIWGKNAEEFDPDRFSRPLPHACAMTPFSYGPRNCVGMRFALMETKLALARVFSWFHFELAPGQVPLEVQNAGPVMRPKNGVRVTVVRRV